MGSPITFSGFNNIDFRAVTDLIIAAERQPLNRLEAQKKQQEDRLTAYGSLGSRLTALQTSFEGLVSNSAYGSLTASSSDTTVLTATTTSSAASKGSFSISVTSLARPMSMSTEAGRFSSTTSPVVDGGSFTITMGGADILNLTDFTTISSLEDLRDAINADQSEVKASIINDGASTNPYRLVLTSATPGLTNSFGVTDNTTLGGTSVVEFEVNPTVIAAQDTAFTYNGITITSTSTSVSDAIPGLSLNLLKEGATAVVTISDDDSVIKGKIQSAVDAFNSFHDFAQEQFRLATTSQGRPPLATDALLRGVNRQLRNLIVSNHTNSGGLVNLAEFGITPDKSGRLQIDDLALDSALAEKRQDVEAFFSGESGFAAKIRESVKDYVQSGGSIDSVETRLQKTIDRYRARIDNLEIQLIFREESLTKMFAAADQAISQLNNQANALAGLGSQFRIF